MVGNRGHWYVLFWRYSIRWDLIGGFFPQNIIPIQMEFRLKIQDKSWQQQEFWTRTVLLRAEDKVFRTDDEKKDVGMIVNYLLYKANRFYLGMATDSKLMPQELFWAYLTTLLESALMGRSWRDLGQERELIICRPFTDRDDRDWDRDFVNNRERG